MKTEIFTPFTCGAFTTLFSKDAAVEALENALEKLEFVQADKTKLTADSLPITFVSKLAKNMVL